MSDLAVFTDPTALDQLGDPGNFVVLACERAKDWLAQAVEHGDIGQIIELKSQAEAIRIYSTQKQLGQDSELAAQEIVRRAERGLGLAIRAGQDSGMVRRQSDGLVPGWSAGTTLSGVPETKIRPGDCFANRREQTETYVLTDAVTDEQFEEAITEAKAERNLTRRNVVRKVKKKKAVGKFAARSSQSEVVGARLDTIRDLAGSGHRAAQIAELVGWSVTYTRRVCRQNHITTVDDVIGSARHIDPDRVVNETVSALEGLVMGLGLIEGDLGRLDPTRVDGWSTSLSSSLRSLNRLSRQLKEMSQ